MKVGDVVIDLTGMKWVIFDTWNYQGLELLCVTDFETQNLNGVVEPNKVKLVGEKPSNVEYMFLKRRERNLEGMERWIK